MPDILIRGVQFPTMKQAYKTLIVSYDGKVYEGVHPQPTAKKEEPIAEAIELPPHGDLIDRDAVDTSYSDPEVVETLFDAPVVIPAEEGKE